MVYLANDFTHLDDVYAAARREEARSKLSSHNATLWTQLTLSPVERMTFKGADGWDVDGFLVKPVGWQSGKKYPMVLSIHGGPAGQYGVDWYHEFQVYAARGWAVFFTNPRGSTGYGDKFERGIELNWGGKDYVDIMNGVNAVIATNPWIDTNAHGCDRRQLRRLHDELDRRPHDALQGGGHAAEHLELHQRRRHARRRVRPQGRFRRRHLREATICTGTAHRSSTCRT